MAVQWAHLGAGTILVATDRGAWLQRVQLGALAISGSMADSGPGTVASTRHLLDGAIALAEREAGKPPTLTPTPIRWAWHLLCQWYCAHHSVALFPVAIERFEALRRPDLARFAELKLEQEADHDLLAAADLRALGYDADALVREVVPSPDVFAAVAYARETLLGKRPVAFIGYIYGLERRALLISENSLVELEAALPVGAEATSFMRAHATEFDVEHVEEAVSFIARLPPADRAQIAVGAYRTTQICRMTLPGQNPTDAELEHLLRGFRKETSCESNP